MEFQYLITGFDSKTEGALDHRMDVRPRHLAYVKQLKEKGNFLFGGAHLDEQDKMIGSTAVLKFETENGIEDYLAHEPYILEKVWEKYKVTKFKLANV